MRLNKYPEFCQQGHNSRLVLVMMGHNVYFESLTPWSLSTLWRVGNTIPDLRSSWYDWTGSLVNDKLKYGTNADSGRYP